MRQMDPKHQNQGMEVCGMGVWECVYDPPEASSRSHSSPPPNVGINRYLISLCLDYLRQPLALKEEGIFRVSGDNSLMKTLHRDFQSGTTSKESLRSEVVDMVIL